MDELYDSVHNRWNIITLMMVVAEKEAQDQTYRDAAWMGKSLLHKSSSVIDFLREENSQLHDPGVNQSPYVLALSKRHRLPIPQGLNRVNWKALSSQQFAIIADSYWDAPASYTPAEVRKALKGLEPLSYDASYLKHFPVLSVVWR